MKVGVLLRKLLPLPHPQLPKEVNPQNQLLVSAYRVNDTIEVHTEADLSKLTDMQLVNLGLHLQLWHQNVTAALRQYKGANSVTGKHS